MSKKLRLFKGRSSKGIRGMQLSKGGKIISLSILDNVQIGSQKIKKDEKLKKGLENLYYQFQKMDMGKGPHILIIGLQIEAERNYRYSKF